MHTDRLPSPEANTKSKLELKSNLNDILPVNYKFIHDSIPNYSDKIQIWIPKIWL